MPVTFQDGPDFVALLRVVHYLENGGSFIEAVMLAETLRTVMDRTATEAAAQQKVQEAVEVERQRMQTEMETKITAIAAEANMQVGILVNERLRQQKEMSDVTGHDILAPIDLTDKPPAIEVHKKRSAAH